MVAVAMQTTNQQADIVKGPVAAESQQSSVDLPRVFKTHKIKFPNKNQEAKWIIDINRGSIEVTSHEREDVWIEVLTPREMAKSGKAEDLAGKKFAPKYDLDIHKKKNQIKLDTYNQGYVLNLRIKVPRATDLDLDTYMDGNILVRNVSGNIKAHTQHSDISLLGVSQGATCYSRNGDIKVRYKEVLAGTQLDLESYNGDITLTLPKSIGATTAVSTGIGSYTMGLPSTRFKANENPWALFPGINSKNQEYQFRRINGGGVPIRIEGEKGKISIGDTPSSLKS